LSESVFRRHPIATRVLACVLTALASVWITGAVLYPLTHPGESAVYASIVSALLNQIWAVGPLSQSVLAKELVLPRRFLMALGALGATVVTAAALAMVHDR